MHSSAPSSGPCNIVLQATNEAARRPFSSGSCHQPQPCNTVLQGLMRRLAAPLLLVVVVAVAAFAWVRSEEPDWYARILYPLEYETIVRGHARNYELDPALL